MPGPGFFREWAVTGGFWGVEDAAPYVGGCPLTGGSANLRRGGALVGGSVRREGS